MKVPILFTLLIAGFCATLCFSPNTITAQSGGSFVALQVVTPGTAQSGNFNVSGTAKVGSMNMATGAASGRVLKSDATGTGTWQADGLTLPYTGSFNSGVNGNCFLVTNTTNFGGSAAIRGESAAQFADGAAVRGVLTHTGASGAGVRGEAAGNLASGVSGFASSLTGMTYGGNFRADSTNGRAVYGLANATTGTAYGGFFEANSTSARAVFATAAAATGTTFGIQSYNSSTGGTAVQGFASATSGTTYGVHGRNDSVAGTGVFGEARAATGTTYGVYGSAASATGFALYGLGRFTATGTKSFRIDHPLDPLNKYLMHYCAEGPEPRNVYQGSVTTDDKGCAWVQLPEYYEAINKDPLYQLTVIEDSASSEFVQVKVARKIHDGRFMIMTSSPSVEVSWRVDAVRNDRFVRANGAAVEVDKLAHERGRYQQPELYPESSDSSAKPVASVR